MVESIEAFIDAVGTDSPQLETEERLRDAHTSSIYSLDEDFPHTALTFKQAKQLVELDVDFMPPSRFESPDEFFSVWESVRDDWSDITVLFGGQLGKYPFIDTTYIVYDNVDTDAFEKYAVEKFKIAMSFNPDDNAGVCPFCTDGIVIEEVLPDSGAYRHTDNDELLLAKADEFDFYRFPGYGDTLRLWWDD